MNDNQHLHQNQTGKRHPISQLFASESVLFWVVVVAFVLLMMHYLQTTLLPFVLGGAIAYLLHPLTLRFERMGMGRTVSTLVALVLFVLVLMGLLTMLVPVASSQIAALTGIFPSYLKTAENFLEGLMQSQVGMSFELDGLAGTLRDNVGSAFDVVRAILLKLAAGSGTVVAFVSFLVITPIVAFFMLRDWPAIVSYLKDLIPRRQTHTVYDLVGRINDKLAAFLRGQGTVCLVLGAFYAIGLTLAGLEFGLIVGLFSGLVSFVPFIGALLGGAISIGLAIVQFGSWEPVAVIAAIYAAGQFLEGNVLTPKLVGDQLGLHPVWVIFALMAGGALFGFLGVLLALPATAVISVLVSFAIERYKQSSYYKSSSS